jgi:predicted enzyme related to lactoylglutathione lyase
MEMQAYEHGVPSWVDVGCRDPAAGAAFYAALFGWDVQEGPPEAAGTPSHICGARRSPASVRSPDPTRHRSG